MRRLAQFVRLASRVRLCASVCVKGSECVRLYASASACVCVCLLASVSRRSSYLASVVSRRSSCLASRVLNACVCLRLASVCVLRLSASVHVKGFECVCLRLFTSRVSNASVCVLRLSASVSRLSVSPCECLRELAHFMRRSSFKEFKRFLLSSYYLCTYRLCRLYEQTFNILI